MANMTQGRSARIMTGSRGVDIIHTLHMTNPLSNSIDITLCYCLGSCCEEENARFTSSPLLTGHPPFNHLLEEASKNIKPRDQIGAKVFILIG